MKKILRKGTRNLPSKWVANCPNCGCQFEYDSAEIKIDSNFYVDDIPPHVQCPECHQYLRHYESQKCSMDNSSTMKT